jgi:dTDP-4-amino-4,6-dideoxygalactose transaminase
MRALLFSRSRHLDRFETDLEALFKRKIILFQSGRGALYYLLRTMPQTTVIVPGYTCKVVPEAILLAGKEVLYVDIDLNTYNMDMCDLRRKMRPESVVLATHQFGIPCDILPILHLAEEHQCVVIEDAAGAFGSRVHDQMVGTFGAASIFSFEFTKVLSSGRGGLILFNEEDLHGRVKSLIEEELQPPDTIFLAKIFLTLLFHKIVSRPFFYSLFIAYFRKKYGFSLDRGEILPHKNELYQYSLSPFEALIGLSNLKKVETISQKRWNIAKEYMKGLSDLQGIGLPAFPPETFSSLMRFPVRVLHQSREAFYSKCLEQGLDLGFSFTYSCCEECPNALLAAQQMVNLPLNSHLTDREVSRIIDIVRKSLR